MCTARKHGRGNIWLQCPSQPSWISEQSEIILNFILCNHLKSHKTKTFFATILNLLTKTQNYLKLSQLLSWIPQKLWHSEIIVLHHPTSPDPTKTLKIWYYLKLSWPPSWIPQNNLKSSQLWLFPTWSSPSGSFEVMSWLTWEDKTNELKLKHFASHCWRMNQIWKSKTCHTPAVALNFSTF